MRKKAAIPVHRMEDKFSGVYIKSLSTPKSAGPGYEISEPHRHDFYYCVLLEKGAMELEVDFQPVSIHSQSLFLSYPGQIHRINSVRMERGWFLAFDPTFLDAQLKSILDQSLSEVILLPLSPEQSSSFSGSIRHLSTVYDDENLLYQQAITRSLITAFIYEVASAYLSMEKRQLISHSARSIDITKLFKQLLRRHFKTIRRPSEYAAQMNITASYLNDTVRSVTGFPVTYYIQQELVREAQRLLSYSGLSVKEIADALGFEDAKYFSRLFSKTTGVSPGAFRKACAVGAGTP